MRIAILTFDGFNEIDAFVALSVSKLAARLERRARRAHAVVTSMNGVRVEREQPLETARDADAVIVGSGGRTREIEVKRLLYQAPGTEGIAPLDAALGLPDEKYTYDLRRIVAEESAKSSFDEVVELVDKRTGGKVAKRQVKELTVRAAQDFDAFYADRLCEPEVTDDLLVLSFDGKGIAMRHADLREATRKAAEAEPKLQTRLTKGEKPNRKRMAQVATVYSIASWPRTSADVLHGLRDDRDARPRPTNKRVWASAQRSAQGAIDDAFAEAHRRDPEHRRRWVVLVDGQRDQIKRIERAAKKVSATITIVLDIVHVLEYLWSAAYAFHKDGTPEAEAWVEHQLVKLLAGRSGGALAKSMCLMVKTHGLDATAAKSVEKAAKYLLKHTRLFHYDPARCSGAPHRTLAANRD
jgi:hypothetical protein